MAEDTVDEVVEHLDGLPRSARRCRTARLHLRGAPARAMPKATGTARHLADRYGTEAAQVQALIDADPSLGKPLVAGLPYLRAEAVHAARHEMATTVDDVLARRTRARLQARDASAAAAPRRRRALAAELGWSRRGDRPPGRGATWPWSTPSERRPGSPATVDGPAVVP